jgi:HEAT repeat protein
MKAIATLFLLAAVAAGCVTVSEAEREAYDRLTDEKIEQLDAKLRSWSDARRQENFVLEQILRRDLRRESSRLIEPLKMGIASKDSETRRIAAASLGFTDDVTVAAMLVLLLDDDEPTVRAAAMLSLCLLQTSRIPAEPIVNAAQDPDPRVRRLAVFCLGVLYDPAQRADLFFPIVEALDDRDEGVRINASSVLAGLQETRVASYLARAGLTDECGYVRKNAAVGLARLEVKETAPALIQALEAEMNPIVRREIVDALKVITGLDLGEDADAWRNAVDAEGLGAIPDAPADSPVEPRDGE